MKLIRLTKQPYGEEIIINTQFISSIEETGDGCVINMTMMTNDKTSFKVRESMDKLYKLASDNSFRFDMGPM